MAENNETVDVVKDDSTIFTLRNAAYASAAVAGVAAIYGGYDTRKMAKGAAKDAKKASKRIKKVASDATVALEGIKAGGGLDPMIAEALKDAQEDFMAQGAAIEDLGNRVVAIEMKVKSGAA